MLKTLVLSLLVLVGSFEVCAQENADLATLENQENAGQLLQTLKYANGEFDDLLENVEYQYKPVQTKADCSTRKPWGYSINDAVKCCKWGFKTCQLAKDLKAEMNNLSAFYRAAASRAA